MRETEIPKFLGHAYKVKCEKCRKEHEFRTQPDYNVGYYIPIFIKCDCRNYIRAQVPAK